MPVARVLTPSDVPELLAFLDSRAEVTMFLRANLAASGLVDGPDPFQGTWVGAFEDGQLGGVAALFWNGNLILAAPAGLAEVARAAVAAAPRELKGLIGPWDEVVAARRALGMEDRPTRLSSKEDLYVLALESLKVPEASGRVVRRAEAADAPLLADWQRAYAIESLGEPTDVDPALSRHAIDRKIACRQVWVVCEDGRSAAMTMFNAVTGDSVQVGGVYTPPAARRRGLARLAVAGSLVDARAAGARTAILFTGDENVAARRAYQALGFAIVGDYGLVLFDG